MKREANFQTFFTKWVRHVFKSTAAFEVKQTTTNSIPYSALAPHQANALMNVSHETFVWKIPDAGYQNPFDCFSLHQTKAYVVVVFPSRKFYLIPIQQWIVQRDVVSHRKSLTEGEAWAISELVDSW